MSCIFLSTPIRTSILFAIAVSLFLSGQSVTATPQGDRSARLAARENLRAQLNAESDSAKRISLLLDLGDLDLGLDNDYTSVEQLWREATAQDDEDALIAAGKSLTLRWINRGQLDSADLWINHCKHHFTGPCAEPTLAYLRMMREIRDLGDLNKVAMELLQRQLTLHDGEYPYEHMRDLFLLGIIASSEQFTNGELQLKTSAEYLEEGYRIACSQPLKESYSFRLQFLVALGSIKPFYAEEMIRTRNDYARCTGSDARRFRSRRAEIMAYARLLTYGDAIGRSKTDDYFRKFNELTTHFPYDSPTPLDFYYYKSVVPYYLYTKQYRKAIQCCDSARINAPKYKMGGWQFYEPRMNSHAALGDYRNAFEDAQILLHIKDSLSAKNATEQLMELQTQYGVDRLKFENRIKYTQLYGALALCALLLGFSAFLIHYARILRRKNRILYQQINQSVRSIKELQHIKQEVTIRPDIKSPLEPTLFDRIELLLADPQIYSDPTLNREKIAALLNTNTTYLSQAIQESSNQSFGEYLTAQRMIRSVQLMQEMPELSLDEISMRVGYGSYSGFYTAFRKQYNLSPRKYIEFLQEHGKWD